MESWSWPWFVFILTCIFIGLSILEIILTIKTLLVSILVNICIIKWNLTIVFASSILILLISRILIICILVLTPVIVLVLLLQTNILILDGCVIVSPSKSSPNSAWIISKVVKMFSLSHTVICITIIFATFLLFLAHR